jgi:hypothetical protein
VNPAESALERRARLLLRAYPADYRRDRGDEIIGTLLEATPPGRSFPLARDAWALVAGARSTRLARNRGASARDDLRLGALLGISVCLTGYFGSEGISLGLLSGWDFPGWIQITQMVAAVAVALAPWLGSRLAVSAVAVPAALVTAYCWFWPPRADHLLFLAVPCSLLVLMGAVVALAGGQPRLPRSWLWLPCAPVATLLAGGLLLPHIDLPEMSDLFVAFLVLLLVIVACWLLSDIRPAFGVGIAVLLGLLMLSLDNLTVRGAYMWLGLSTTYGFLLCLAAALALMVPTGWLILRSRRKPRTA